MTVFDIQLRTGIIANLFIYLLLLLLCRRTSWYKHVVRGYSYERSVMTIGSDKGSCKVSLMHGECIMKRVERGIAPGGYPSPLSLLCSSL